MTELTIDSVCTKGPLYPMLVNFQNGYPNEYFENECAILQDNAGARLIATELSDLVYSGKEENEDLGKTLILVRNNKTGKVRLIEAGWVELTPESKVDLDSTQTQDASMLELSRKFGSKKQKKQMEQREKLKVNVQTVTEQMETVTANVTVDQLDLSEYNKTDTEDIYVPPIDRDAKKVEDVYVLDKILTDEEFNQIYEELPAKLESVLHPYMKSFVKDKNLSPKLTVLSVYASELIKFLNISYSSIQKKDFLICEFSETLNRILMNGFLVMQKTKKTRTQQMKDKTICYIFVLMLLLNNFKIQLDPLCAVLKVSPKLQSCLNKVRVIGAHILHIDGLKYMELKLPLAPKFSLNRRKSAKF